MKRKLFALAGALLLLTACSAKAALTQEQAQEAALNHAGFTADQVSGLRCYRDFDDGRTEYEIEFFINGMEYDYTIDGNTGDILDFDTDGTPIPTSNEVPPATVIAELTKEDAEAIALEYAGFTADQVVGLRTKYEIDDGIPVYEIDFHVERTEYDCTIHAATGEILEWEIDD